MKPFKRLCADLLITHYAKINPDPKKKILTFSSLRQIANIMLFLEWKYLIGHSIHDRKKVSQERKNVQKLMKEKT